MDSMKVSLKKYMNKVPERLVVFVYEIRNDIPGRGKQA